ncbi:MAG: ABC transporter ATP-binding protein [Planctomycetota bacterium]|nr:ABC transporter ATP-binding protein [Planctomycetota bacterium]MDI6787201.1 ABC transporter ATP-binding protein [Planctomycetota bacterium]
MTNYHYEDEILGKVYDTQLMKRLLGYARPYYRLIIISLVIVLLSIAVFLCEPLLIALAIDKGIRPKDTSVLTLIALAYLGVTLLNWLLGFLSTYTLSYLGNKIMYDLRMQIFSHLQKLSLRYFDKNPVGRMVTRVTNDIQSLSELFSVGLVTVFSDIFRIIGLIIVMFYLNYRLTFISLSVAILLIPIAFFFQKVLRNVYRDIRKKLARINAYIAENISGIRVTHLFNREIKNIEEFENINNEHFKASYDAVRYYSLFVPSATILRAIAIGLAIYFGGNEVVKNNIEIGIWVAFLSYMVFFFEPIQDLADKYTLFQSSMASAERVFKILDTAPEITDPPQPVRILSAIPIPSGQAGQHKISGKIEFENVWFSYESEQSGLSADLPAKVLAQAGALPDRQAGSAQTGGSRDVLKGVSFTLQPGESVALVGITGAGKSTIINLLCRFYDVTRGRILIDGVDIRLMNQQDLRRLIGVVHQDVFLFSGNIMNNIKLGQKDISEEHIREVCRYVNAQGFIERLPGEYYAPVQERGVTLSAGQRQLLSFARVLVFDPSILVLDEATSAVDIETERAIQDAIGKIIKQRTSLIIAHRLSTIQNVDRIMVVHKGEIRETGTHDELIAKQGLYYKLYQIQLQPILPRTA